MVIEGALGSACAGKRYANQINIDAPNAAKVSVV